MRLELLQAPVERKRHRNVHSGGLGKVTRQVREERVSKSANQRSLMRNAGERLGTAGSLPVP